MESFAQILPLAITMIAGPQILSAIILITSRYPVRSSLAYISAVALAATAGTLALFLIFKTLGVDALGGGEGRLGKIIETSLVALLIFMSIRTYAKRAEIKPPKWMKSLQQTTPKNAFILGLTLIFLMPSDIMIMTTVALHLISRGLSYVSAIPFIILTTLIAALPLIIYELFKKRATTAMPGVNSWMDKNSWMIQIFVYIIFIVLIW